MPLCAPFLTDPPSNELPLNGIWTNGSAVGHVTFGNCLQNIQITAQCSANFYRVSVIDNIVQQPPISISYSASLGTGNGSSSLPSATSFNISRTDLNTYTFCFTDDRCYHGVVVIHSPPDTLIIFNATYFWNMTAGKTLLLGS